MAQLLTCPHGHQWPAPDKICPVCGAVGQLPSTELYLAAPFQPGQELAEAVTVPPNPSPKERVRSDAVTLAPVEQPPDLAERLQIAGYEIVGELGRGGMGVVYQARDLSLKRLVALKMILAGAHAGPRELARFRIEAEAVARLQHPNIVQIYEVGEQDGRPYLALEFIEGGSLAQKLNGQPLPPDEAAPLVETLARAIHFAHQRGIIHRDLKPANILLVAGGAWRVAGKDRSAGPDSRHAPPATLHPKITDFGLAKQVDSALGAPAVSGCTTQTGAIMGTPGYMAPEQAGGRTREIGPAVDIYALGAILYEMLTGQPPFQGASTLDVIWRVVSEEPVPPRRLKPKVPRDLETICLKCLEKEPRRRYATAQDLADDLARFQRGETITARPLGPAGRLARWARLRPALAATWLALAVFYANHLVLMNAGRTDEGGVFHLQVTGVMLAWALGAAGFQWLVGKPRYRPAAIFGWAAMDVLLFTVFLLVADGPKSGLVSGYLLLVAAAALRFRIVLVWFVTALCLLSYAGLFLDAQGRRPDKAVDGAAAVMFLLCLVMMGVVLHLLLRRLRTATLSDGGG